MEKKYEDNYKIDQVTLEEVWQGYDAAFSYYGSICDPTLFPGCIYPWHWHNYVQFIYVLSGSVNYQTESGTYTFKKGSGGFINSNVLHMIRSADKNKTLFVEQLFHPFFIGGGDRNEIMTRYVLPVTEDTSFDVYLLDQEVEEHTEILNLLREAFHLYKEKEECYELLIRSTLTRMWAVFYQVSKDRRNGEKRKVSSDRLKVMLHYINEHFTEKISLEDIAAVGACSKRECGRVFQKQLHLTPFQYLTQVRMSKAGSMLLNTNLSMAHISQSCGFSDPSHFAKAFRAQQGLSPREFRNQNR